MDVSATIACIVPNLEYGTLLQGEVQDVDEVCFTCDECRHWGGDHNKRSQWRKECPKHKYPQKYIEAKAEADKKGAEKLAQKCRKAFRVIDGGQHGTIDR